MRVPERHVEELASLTTEELIHLDGILSGGRWLGNVRFALNWRLIHDHDLIKRSVSPHTWSVINKGGGY
jgi:hypothetical protein